MSDHWIALSALVVAFVAAFFTALQWASAYRSAASAERSAKAAEDTVTLAEKGMLKTQRAWLLVSEVKRRSTFAQGFKEAFFDVDASVKNYGLTPALEVTIALQIGLSKGAPDEFNITDAQRPSQITLGPGEVVTTTRGFKITDTEFEEVRTWAKNIVVMVHVSYRHLFSDGSVSSSACLLYNPYLKTFMGADKHNRAD